MPRIKRGVVARAAHKKVLRKAKGFRGREMAHQEIGMRLLERVRGDLDPHGVVEQFPRMEGRQLVMVLSPKKVAKPPPRPSAKAAGATPAAGSAAKEDAPKTESAAETMKK